MESPPHAASHRHGRLLGEIDAARTRTSSDAVVALGAALDTAGREESRERAEALDRAVLDVLRDAPHRDRILDRLDLDALAELAARVAARPAREAAWDLLDVIRRPAVLRRVDAAGDVAAWADRILALVDASHLTMATVLRRRADEYGAKVLFEIPTPGHARSVTWRQTAARVDRSREASWRSPTGARRASRSSREPGGDGALRPGLPDGRPRLRDDPRTVDRRGHRVHVAPIGAGIAIAGGRESSPRSGA